MAQYFQVGWLGKTYFKINLSASVWEESFCNLIFLKVEASIREQMIDLDSEFLALARRRVGYYICERFIKYD